MVKTVCVEDVRKTKTNVINFLSFSVQSLIVELEAKIEKLVSE